MSVSKLVHEAQETLRKNEYPSLYPDFETTFAEKRAYYAKHYGQSKTVTLLSKDEKKLKDSSIKEIIIYSRLRDFTPYYLQVEIVNISNKFTLDVGRKYGGGLSYSVDCFDQKIKDEILFDIDSWIDKNKPSRPKQMWGSTWLFFVIMGFLYSILLLLSVFTFESYYYKPAYKKELNAILSNGINKENQAKAQELFIKYSMDYLPEDVRDKQVIKIDYLWLRVAVVMFLIALASIFRPQTTIGLG